MSIFFTADTHFQDADSIGWWKRPFRNAREMDAALTANWNAVVQPDDIVYHLGDVFSGNPETALPKLYMLAGQKFLIPGNHDEPDQLTAMRDIFTILPPLVEIPFPGSEATGKTITLCHYAMRTWKKSHKWSIHLFGHTHGALPDSHQSCDVGVDCWDFHPVSIKEIKIRLRHSHGLAEDSIQLRQTS